MKGENGSLLGIHQAAEKKKKNLIGKFSHTIVPQHSTETAFLEERKTVLGQWKTGSDPALDLETSVAFLKSLPDEKNFAKKLAKAKLTGRTTVQPRAGVPMGSRDRAVAAEMPAHRRS